MMAFGNLDAAEEIRPFLHDVERIEDARRNGVAVLVANERLAEIADPLERGGNRQQGGRALVVAQPVIAAEEEQLVAQDRTADASRRRR